MVNDNDTQLPSLVGKAAPICQSWQIVLDVVIARQRNGATNLTDREIRDVLEFLHSPRRFEVGQVANRVSDLVKAGLLKESEPRLNPKTKKMNRTVFAPAQQGRLVS
jgi:hypothetical protein